MKRLQVLVLLFGLMLGREAWAFMVLHVGSDLANPEMYVPTTDGLRPGPGSRPRPVFYTIDLKGTFLVPGSLNAILRSFQHWNDVDGATALFIPAGVKLFPAAPEWKAFPNGDNALIWVTEGWLFGPEIIAYTYIMANNPTGAIIESDIYINAQNYSWAVLEEGRDYPGLYVADVENIITHEAGHMLGLAHSQVPLATMSGSAGYLGQTRRRTLHPDDEDAVRYQYPAGEEDYPAPSLWGIRKDNCFFDDSLFYPFIEIDAGAGNTGFCLFGAGFYSTSVAPGLKLDGNAITPNPVSGASRISENLVLANLDYSSLATNIYDPSVTNPNGKTGSKFQGIVINQAGNQLPVARASALPETVRAGGVVTLDGSSSTDPEGAPLSYEWIVAEEPPGAGAAVQNPYSMLTNVALNRPGAYVFYLVVNDGIVDGIAAAVTVTALAEQEDEDDDDDEALFGCMQVKGGSNISGPAACLNLLLMSVPVLAALFAFILRIRGRAAYQAFSSSGGQKARAG